MFTKTRKRCLAILLMVVIAASIILTVKFNFTASAYSVPVYMDTPQITVLTHGLGSGASYWSNRNGTGDLKFAEDSDSLVYKLSDKAGGAFIYRAETQGGSDNPIYKLFKGYATSDYVTKINDISKHIIIVFDSKSPNVSNEAVYSEFKNMLNGVIKDVQALNAWKFLPKVNLIGHSRGGITNLLYTLDYPQYIDSLISIGTPYFGPEPAESIGEIVFGDTDGFKDINKESLYNEYYYKWSQDYESKYKDINSIAIGGATDISYLRKLLSNSSAAYADALTSLLKCFENAVFQFFTVPYLKTLYPKLVQQYPALEKFGEENFVEIVQLLDKEIHYGTWYSDVLVPVDSQQGVSVGKNYYFTKHVKVFDSDNSPANPKLAVNSLPVIHNIETYDADIHNYILNNIIMKKGDSLDNEISNVNKIELGSSTINNLIWQIKIRNIHTEERTYAYNAKMCNFDDAKNWTGLKDIEAFRLKPGETKIVDISSNGTATSVAISSTNGNNRYIKYADNLWFQSNILYDDNIYKMTVYDNTIPYYTYSQYGMKVGIACKTGDTWTIELTNNSGSDRVFEYNSRMCFDGDARTWTNLSHVASVYIANHNADLIKIQENGTANSIAISYNIGISRHIFYAYNLATPSGAMNSYSNLIPKYYTQNGIEAAIVKKVNSTWYIQITNYTGKKRIFEYNSRMCFEGDAQNWTNLSDVKTIELNSGQTSSVPIEITEYGTATSIAISYMDGDIYRKIFYAKNLNAIEHTMTAMSNTIDTTVQDSCLAAGTLITLADGSQKAVEALTGDEMLLVWNMQTGTFDSAPILFIDSEPLHTYNIINLHFSDATNVKVIYEHGFWDYTLNKYVYLDVNAEQYIGHWFNKQSIDSAGNFYGEKVQLTDVSITQEYTTAWSPVTYGHLCYYVNGMLSMPGGINGLFNIFEVNPETMIYDEAKMQFDIEIYGLFTYEEFAESLPVSELVFNAFGGQYLKIAIGKGLITWESLKDLAERYAEILPE